jgi:chromosome segregation ATPase
MSLDFGHTCPDIDASLASIKEDMRYHVSNIMDDITVEIEKVRATNEEMRKAADEQIEALMERIDELENENKELQEELEEVKAGGSE